LGTDSYTRCLENLFAKTKAFNNEGITAYCITSAYQYPPLLFTGSVVKDIAFISEVIGCKAAISDHRCSYPTREELIRLASECRLARLVSGKPGVLHLHVGSGTDGIACIFDIVRATDIPALLFRPTHMARHPNQAVEFTRIGGYADFTAKPKLPADFRDVMREAANEYLTISSDSNGTMLIWDEKREHVAGTGIGKITNLYGMVRELITKYDVPVGNALSFITKNVAQALEMYPRKGAVKEKSDADLVLLDKDLNIDTVIAKGRVMMSEKNVLAKGMFE